MDLQLTPKATEYIREKGSAVTIRRTMAIG